MILGNESAPDWQEGRVEPILRTLASRPPIFHLPPVRSAHTRSFLNQNERDPAKKALIFDAFVALDPRARVLAGWLDVALEEQQQADLAELLTLLNYVGRSESWVKAEILPVHDHNWNCFPAAERVETRGMSESVLVASPLPPVEYDSNPLQRKLRGKKARMSEISWLEALGWSTRELLDSRRTEPPAFQYVSYSRPAKCFDPPPRNSLVLRRRIVNGVLYALDSKVPAVVTATLEVAEQGPSISAAEDRKSAVFLSSGVQLTTC